jgi:hypothetical protein
VRRVRDGERHPIHLDSTDPADYDRRWTGAEPLHVGPVLRVDTSARVDLESIAQWIEKHRQETDRPEPEPEQPEQPEA